MGGGEGKAGEVRGEEGLWLGDPSHPRWLREGTSEAEVRPSCKKPSLGAGRWRGKTRKGLKHLGEGNRS